MNQAQNADVPSVTASNQLKILGLSSQAHSTNMASIREMRSKLEQETSNHKDVLSIFPLYSSQLPHIHIFAIIVQGFPHPPSPYSNRLYNRLFFNFKISVCVCMFTLHWGFVPIFQVHQKYLINFSQVQKHCQISFICFHQFPLRLEKGSINTETLSKNE